MVRTVYYVDLIIDGKIVNTFDMFCDEDDSQNALDAAFELADCYQSQSWFDDYIFDYDKSKVGCENWKVVVNYVENEL